MAMDKKPVTIAIIFGLAIFIPKLLRISKVPGYVIL